MNNKLNKNDSFNEKSDGNSNDKHKGNHVTFDCKTKNKVKKPRRQHSQSFCVSSEPNFEYEDIQVLSKDDTHKNTIPDRLPYGKNSKKSRMGNKEGKRGLGGKAKWNYRDDVVDDLEIDKKDPCYDSENELGNIEENLETYNEEKFDELITTYVKEYYENSDTYEFQQNLEDMNLNATMRARITYLCILQALQRKPAQCELTSRLLCDLIGNVMNQSEMAYGFDLVIQELRELTIDCPEAPIIVGKFIARAVADHLLTQKFVPNYKFIQQQSNNSNKINNNNTLSEEQLRALAKAENLLSLNNAYVRLDTVWGSPGGERPTKMLTTKIKLLLTEYLDSSDEVEAQRCLSELEAPHFHHEVVYQAILMAIEKSTEFVCTCMVRLLDSLCEYVTITVDQLEQGVERIYDQMTDIVLDVPAAYIILERFVMYAQKNASFFPDHLVQKMPKNTRTRFVSEGNGFIR